MSTVKTMGGPINHVRLGCLTCKRYHDAQIPCEDSTRLLRELEAWEYKHPSPRCVKPSPVVRFEVPRDYDDSRFEAAGEAPWWLDPSLHGMRENNNYQTSYVASAALTITLAALASDASLLAGRSSVFVDNGATGAPLEVGVSAVIENNTGSTPTVGTAVQVYAYSDIDDTPTYPDNILGTDANVSISTANNQNSALKLAASMTVAAVKGTTYPTGWNIMSQVALGALFGGWLPRYWGVWIVQSSGQSLAGGTVTQKGLYIAG